MEFAETISTRRAVNFFDPEKPVSEELIRKIIGLAALAPSSFNLQPWNLIRVEKKEDKQKLMELAWNQPKIMDAPLTFIVLGDRNGHKSGHPVLEKNFREMVRSGAMTEDRYDWFIRATKSLYGESHEKEQAFACKNAGFFAMSLMLAAKSLGVDTHPMDGFDHEGVKKAFSIPEEYWIPVLIAVGYFDTTKTLAESKWRKSCEEIVLSFDK